MKSQYVVIEVSYDPDEISEPNVWDWNLLFGEDIEVLYVSEFFDSDKDE
jgi:hypothetical protein